MFWNLKKQLISNENCPITLMPIQDLVRENPSSVVVFHHPQKKICFAYDKQALMYWFYTSSKNVLLQGAPEFARIILQDPLSTLSLDALTLKKSKPFVWFRIDEQAVEDFEHCGGLLITLLPLLIIYQLFPKAQFLNPPTDEPINHTQALIGIFIISTILDLGWTLAAMTQRYTGPRLRAIAREQAETIRVSREELFQKNFKDWFEKNYLPFEPTQHQLPVESVQIAAQNEIFGYRS